MIVCGYERKGNMKYSQEIKRTLRKINPISQLLADMTQNAQTSAFHISPEASIETKDKDMEVEKPESNNAGQTSQDKEKDRENQEREKRGSNEHKDEDVENKNDNDEMILEGEMQVEEQVFTTMEKEKGRSQIFYEVSL